MPIIVTGWQNSASGMKLSFCHVQSLRTRSEPLSVLGVGDAVDGVLVALERLDERPVGRVVDEDALPGGDDELRPVGAEAEVVDALLVPVPVVHLVHPSRHGAHLAGFDGLGGLKMSLVRSQIQNQQSRQELRSCSISIIIVNSVSAISQWGMQTHTRVLPHWSADRYTDDGGGGTFLKAAASKMCSRNASTQVGGE